MNEFDEFMIEVGNKERLHLDKFEDGIDFLSLRRYSENEAIETNIDHKIVEDPFFATSLNSKGEIQIGKDVYKVAKDYVYKVPKEKDHILHTIVTQNVAGESVELQYQDQDDLEIFPIKRARANASSASNKTGSLPIDICYAGLGSENETDYRLKGKSWITHWSLYSSAGVLIESQKEKWYGWRRAKAARITVDADYDLWTVRITTSGNTTLVQTIHRKAGNSYYRTKSNAKEIEERLYHATGDDLEIRGEIESEHEARRNNTGLTRSCITDVERDND